MRRQAKRQKGFSLIEMLTVIGIMVVLVSIGTPNYINYRQKAAIDADAQKVVAALREAISRARSGTEGARWAFYVDEANDWFAVRQGPTVDPQTYISRTQLDSLVQFDQDITENTNNYWFHQSPNLTIATSTMVIGLTTQNGGFTDTITMDTLGRITRESNY